MRKDVRSKFVLILGLVLLLSLVVVTAQESGRQDKSLVGDVGEIIGGAVDILDPILAAILGEPIPERKSGFLGISFLGGESDTQFISRQSDYFSKLMFFIIVFALIWIALSKIPLIEENHFILWVVTIAVTFLSTRWLGKAGVVQSLLLPYDTLGITLSAFLPIIIFFAFVEFGLKGPEYRTIRKTAWLAYGVVFVFFWFIRYPEIVKIGKIVVWIYPISALVCFAFFWFDGTMQKWLAKIGVDKLRASNSVIRTLEHRRLKLKELYADPDNDDTRRNELSKEINKINDEIIKISTKGI